MRSRELLEAFDHVLRQPAVIASGTRPGVASRSLTLHGANNWCGLLLDSASALDGALGGYAGHPSMGGGRDRQVVVQANLT